MRASEPAYKHLLPQKDAGPKPIAQLQASTGVGSISSPVNVAQLPETIAQPPKTIAQQVQVPSTVPQPTAVVQDPKVVAQLDTVATASPVSKTQGTHVPQFLQPPFAKAPTVGPNAPPEQQKDSHSSLLSQVLASTGPAPVKAMSPTIVLPGGIKVDLSSSIHWAKLVALPQTTATSHADPLATSALVPRSSVPTTLGTQAQSVIVHSVKSKSGSPPQQVGGAAAQQVGGAVAQQVGGSPPQKVGGAAAVQVGVAPKQQVGVVPTQQGGGVLVQQVGVAPMQMSGAPAQVRKLTPLPITGGAPMRGVVTQRQRVTPTQLVGGALAQQVGGAPAQQVGGAPVATQENTPKSTSSLDLILEKIAMLKTALSPPACTASFVLPSNVAPSTTVQSTQGTTASNFSSLHPVASTSGSVSIATTIPTSPMATQIMAEHSYQGSPTPLSPTTTAEGVSAGTHALETSPSTVQHTTNPPRSHSPAPQNPTT